MTSPDSRPCASHGGLRSSVSKGREPELVTSWKNADRARSGWGEGVEGRTGVAGERQEVISGSEKLRRGQVEGGRRKREREKEKEKAKKNVVVLQRIRKPSHNEIDRRHQLL